MAKRRRSDEKPSVAKSEGKREPWSKVITQQELAKHPGEMGARRLAVANLKKADIAQRKTQAALKGDHTLYD